MKMTIEFGEDRGNDLCSECRNAIGCPFADQEGASYRTPVVGCSNHQPWVPRLVVDPESVEGRIRAALRQIKPHQEQPRDRYLLVSLIDEMAKLGLVDYHGTVFELYQV